MTQKVGRRQQNMTAGLRAQRLGTYENAWGKPEEIESEIAKLEKY